VKELLGTTARQRLVAAVVVALGVLVVAAVLAEQWSLGAAASGLLLTGATLAAVDLRRRAGDLQRRLVRQAEGTRVLVKAAESTRRGVHDLTSNLDRLTSTVSAVEAALVDERRRLAEERRRNAASLRRIVELATRQPQEIEALFQLYGKVSPTAPMPPSGEWALNPTGLLNVYALVEQQRPRLVVELGSGTSTVWLGYAVVQQGYGRVVSVDHLPDYAEHTRMAIDRHGLTSISEVRDAPLTEITVGDETYKWYDPSLLADLDQIDLLLVDGPPGTTGHEARYPALPMLRERLANGALVVLDDIDRVDEQEILERWLKQTPGLTREATLVGEQAVLRYHWPHPTGSD
jgi:predicted O-methyltransferase YrrM